MVDIEIARMHYENSQIQTRSGNLKKRDEALYGACQDFEAIFVRQMLKSMKSTIEKTGLLDGGFAEEVYDDMLYDEYAKKMVKTGGFGVADMLYNQLANDIK